MAAKKTPKSKKIAAKPGGGKAAPNARLFAKSVKVPTNRPKEAKKPPKAAKPEPKAKAAPPAKAQPAKAAAPAKALPPSKAVPAGNPAAMAMPVAKVPPPVKGAPAPKLVSEAAPKSAKAAKGAPTPRAEKRGPEQKVPREKAPPSLREPPRVVPLPIPVLPPIARPSIEDRAADIDKRLEAQSEDFKRRYIANFDMSWIYHDSALEGVVYTFDELRGGLSGQVPPVTDSSLQPTSDDIRRHKEAIDFVRDFAIKKRLPVTLDVIKKIYLILRPEEGDIKTVKYRKDVPQHRLYFHEYAAPDKIAYKVRGVIDWLNSPESRKTRNGIRIAARAHYDLLRAYPFPHDSGKVARLFMNLLLLRSGLPPSIIHSTERQRYYEALKGSANIVLQMVQESVENALSSVEKLLDEHETRTRAFVS
ncbi:MAG: Fic family protein [Polyangiaceae bacterium]